MRSDSLLTVADHRFVIDDFEPTYLRLQREGGFPGRVEEAPKELEDCHACPRN